MDERTRGLLRFIYNKPYAVVASIVLAWVLGTASASVSAFGPRESAVVGISFWFFAGVFLRYIYHRRDEIPPGVTAGIFGFAVFIYLISRQEPILQTSGYLAAAILAVLWLSIVVYVVEDPTAWEDIHPK